MTARAKKPSKRQVALAKLRKAGYHEDRALFTQVYVEERVSLKVAKEQYQAGRRLKAAGVPCGCYKCRKES